MNHKSIGASMLIRGWVGWIACSIASIVMAQDASSPKTRKHIQGGEFVRAKQIAFQALPTSRDGILAQVAGMQSRLGDTVGSAGTIREIESATYREAGINGGQATAGQATAGQATAGQGGGSFADFQSLIDLIQTTVVPDTWEALGGPSTMSEYAAGIYVDARGTVHQCETKMTSSEADNLRAWLKTPAMRSDAVSHSLDSWRTASPLRFVSLRRLLDQLTLQRVQATSMSIETLHLGGLANVQYILISDDDVVLAGAVGGIEQQQGWYRDANTKQHPLRADFLFTCLDAAFSGQPFGCSIDPSAAGLQRTARLAVDVKEDRVPIGQAAEKLREAMGMQQVEVFGTAADRPLGYLMVAADRHMKHLALGKYPLPVPAKSYLDMIDQHLAQGTPDDLLLRLWFTTSPRQVRSDSSRQVFELTGTPIRLSGQNERALASGERGHLAVDPRTQAFVNDFNRNWSSIRQSYPIYGALESIYQAASIAELLHRHASPRLREGLLAMLAAESSAHTGVMPTPRQVESIATMHTVRQGRSRHHILLASGGVAVEPGQSIASQIETYPALASVAQPIESRPVLIQRWWWNHDSQW